ncbi:MAG: protein kinase [Phycisphaerales bacterium]
MPRLLGAGTAIKDYTVVKELHRGAKAVAYQVRRPDGTQVFLKLYKSPTPMVPWYRDYIAYEERKKQRIVGSSASAYCLAPIEIFEWKHGSPTLFQAFEFISDGGDLKSILGELSSDGGEAAWNKRVLISKVFIAALDEVASVGIVHGDLKPENIHLLRRSDIAAGFRPKLIDMDASLLTDQRAPWHGQEGYMGTPNYFSPEHDRQPIPASDVFTASLILHELLCRSRPYPDYASASEIAKLVKDRPAPMPVLRGSLGGPAMDLHFRQVLRACLAPDPANRPTVKELRRALLGVSPPPPPPPPPTEGGAGARTLRLKTVGGARALEFNIRTTFDHTLAKQLSPVLNAPTGEFFRVRRADGRWIIEPLARGGCAVACDGRPLTGSQELKSGGRIRLTWGVRGEIALELEVEFL